MLTRTIARLTLLLLDILIAARICRAPSWWHERPDLPVGSTQQLAAAIRGEFGTAIAWMCRRRGIGPAHPDWPELARAITTFGGKLEGYNFSAPACGLQWWENPHLVPGIIGDVVATPAADALAARQALRTEAESAPPAPPRPAAATAVPAPSPWLPLLRRAGTGPPTGPPPPGRPTSPRLISRGRQSTASPAVLIPATRLRPHPRASACICG